MSNRTFAIVGCQHAHISVFIEEMLELGYTPAGIYEPDHVKMRNQMSQRYGMPVVERAETLLAGDCRVVGSSAVNNEKIDVVELCERYGKPVMLDKPAVTDRDGYDRLKGVIERGKIQVGLMLTERFSPAIYTLKQMIDQGRLGRLLSLGMRKPHQLNLANRPDWFFSKTRSGGIVVDLFIHDVDLLRWLTGAEIESVDGVMYKNILPEHPTFYDLASLQVVMGNQVLGQLYADWHTPDQSWTWGDGRIFAAGTEGNAELRLYGDPLIRDEALVLSVTDGEPYAPQPIVSPPVTMMEDFMQRAAGEQGLITHDDILKASEAVLLADERVKIIRTA